MGPIVRQRLDARAPARVRLHASLVLAAALMVALVPAQHVDAATAQGTFATAQCVATTGPGIPPPASVPSGLPGFHASWYGQSGYPTLCPGQRTTATVAFYNSGTRGWVAGRPGETALLGTWDTTAASDGARAGIGSDPSWPAPDRPAAQPAQYVGPNQVAWFQFSVTAPAAPGTYRLYIRPVIEGLTWMENEGVFWEMNVVAPRADTVAIIPVSRAIVTVGTDREYTAISSDGSCLDLALVDEVNVRGDGTIVDSAGHARLSNVVGTITVGGAPANVPFVRCAQVGADHLLRFSIRASAPGEIRPLAFRDLDGDDAFDVATESFALGGTLRSLPITAERGQHLVTVGSVNLEEHFLVDSAGAALYRYDVNDRFERNGIAMTVAWFEQLVSRGDVLNVSYETDPAVGSTFTFINDVGRQSPTARAVIDSWDGGATQNDIGITVTEPATNVDGIAYALERAVALYGTTCDGNAGAFNGIASLVTSGDEALYVDRDLAIGAYCYRVGVSDPLSAETSYSYTARIVVTNPPAAVVPPRSIDARLTASVGSAATIDAGDVMKIAFDKVMRAPGTATIRLVDVDGTTAELRCGVEAMCTLNTAVETLGGFGYPAGTVVIIEVRTAPHVLTPGSVPGLGSPATLVAADLRDFAGNPWNVSASDDVVVGAPD